MLCDLTFLNGHAFNLTNYSKLVMCIKKKNQWIRDIPTKKKILQEKKRKKIERNANIIAASLALLCHLLQWGFHLMLFKYFYFNNITYN